MQQHTDEQTTVARLVDQARTALEAANRAAEDGATKLYAAAHLIPDTPQMTSRLLDAWRLADDTADIAWSAKDATQRLAHALRSPENDQSTEEVRR